MHPDVRTLRKQIYEGVGVAAEGVVAGGFVRREMLGLKRRLSVRGVQNDGWLGAAVQREVADFAHRAVQKPVLQHGARVAGGDGETVDLVLGKDGLGEGDRAAGGGGEFIT